MVTVTTIFLLRILFITIHLVTFVLLSDLHEAGTHRPVFCIAVTRCRAVRHSSEPRGCAGRPRRGILV